MPRSAGSQQNSSDVERKLTKLQQLRRLKADLDALDEGLGSSREAQEPYPWQVPPLGDWRYWLLMGGRGIGKTDGGAEYFDDQMSIAKQRGRIIAPTIGDARGACVEGISGLLVRNPLISFNRSWGELTWPNGSKARIFGAYTPDDVERLRAGGNSHVDWYEELAAWRQLEAAWQQADLGLRLGPNPHAIITTTPKPRLLVKALARAAGRRSEPMPDDAPTWLKSLASLDASLVVATTGSTRDATHLDPAVRARFFDTYAGTRLAAQELEGEIVDDIEGALWSAELLERCHVETADAPLAYRRIVVAVDPSWGTTNDECGIVVAGLGFDGRGYVLEDCSMRAAPAAWGAAVAAAYRHWKADMIVAEVNFQAEQVRLVMHTTDPGLAFKELRASRGKQQRAEPVLALYEQHKISHVGRFARLEAQMTEWVPGESDVSPDRVDALVWALTELMLSPGGPSQVSVPSSTSLGRAGVTARRAGRDLGRTAMR
jgi:phage terminase large subunit-like protein